MHLRPGVPGRRRHPRRGGHPQPDIPGYQSTAGYVGYFVNRAPAPPGTSSGPRAGPAVVSLRYYNVASPPLHRPPSTLDLEVNGRLHRSSCRPHDGGRNPGRPSRPPCPCVSGTNSIRGGQHHSEQLRPGPRHPGRRSGGSPPPSPPSTGPLGGWFRGFDTYTYNDTPTCGPGQSGATCQATIEPLHTDGLLDTAGWRLLDDTQSALWTTQGWVNPGRRTGDVEDGYLFVYGTDYAGALHTLAQLDRPGAPASPQTSSACGTPTTRPTRAPTSKTRSIPPSSANQVPLNTLSLDTDWKAPNDWDGWEWNRSLFPSPSSFLRWARSHGIDVTLNIHSSIDDNDPKLPQAERIAGHTLATSSCTSGNCKVWDWSSVPQAESNFALQQSFQQQGVSFWWLDWCCDNSVVSVAGRDPRRVDRPSLRPGHGQPGRAGLRAGPHRRLQRRPAGGVPGRAMVEPHLDHRLHRGRLGNLEHPGPGGRAGPRRGHHRRALREQRHRQLPRAAANAAGADPPDLYDRWVQLGTFQPILRLHSNNEDRLPWQYPQPVQGITEAFLRLREALLPVHLHLGRRGQRDRSAHGPAALPRLPRPTGGLPEPDGVPLRLRHAGGAGDHAGDVASTTVWFPPGRGSTSSPGPRSRGPSTATLSVPLDRMPVFVRQVGSCPSSPPRGGTGAPDALTALVYPGSAGILRPLWRRRNGLGLHQGPAHARPSSPRRQAHPEQKAVGLGHDRRGPRAATPASRPLSAHHRRHGRRHPTGAGHPRRSDRQRAGRWVRPGLVLSGVDGHADGARRVAAGREHDTDRGGRRIVCRAGSPARLRQLRRRRTQSPHDWNSVSRIPSQG